MKAYSGTDQDATPASLVNASIEWLSRSETFSVRLWAANLTSTHYLGYTAQNALGRMIVAGEPRTYGATFGAHF